MQRKIIDKQFPAIDHPIDHRSRLRRFYFGMLVVGTLCCAGVQTSCANNAPMNATLVKIIEQLQAIKPLINQAKQQQAANPRVTIHFDPWVDVNGKQHSGLRQDISAIQKALTDAVNRQQHAPRVYAPIKGDFTGQPNV